MHVACDSFGFDFNFGSGDDAAGDDDDDDAEEGHSTRNRRLPRRRHGDGRCDGHDQEVDAASSIVARCRQVGKHWLVKALLTGYQ